MRTLPIGALALFLVAHLLAASAAADAPPPATATSAASASEPLWVSIVLAPSRIVLFGRFDAALPSYHARLAAQKAEQAEAARAARCRGCCRQAGTVLEHRTAPRVRSSLRGPASLFGRSQITP